MTVDPGTLFPFLLGVVLAAIAYWWPSRRDVAEAGKADAEGWDLLIRNLREEVQRVQTELDEERAERKREQDEHRREIARVEKRRERETAALRAEVWRLRRLVEGSAS